MDLDSKEGFRSELGECLHPPLPQSLPGEHLLQGKACSYVFQMFQIHQSVSLAASLDLGLIRNSKRKQQVDWLSVSPSASDSRVRVLWLKGTIADNFTSTGLGVSLQPKTWFPLKSMKKKSQQKWKRIEVKKILKCIWNKNLYTP